MTYLVPKKFDMERFYGEHLRLVNHDCKTICDLGKILAGGAFCEQRLSDFDIDDNISRQDVRDARSFFLLQSVGDNVELVIENSPRSIEIEDSGYEFLTIGDLVRTYWNNS